MKLIFDFVRSKTKIMNTPILQLNLIPMQIILSIIPLGIGGIVPFNALFKVPTDGCGSFLCASDAPSLTGTVTTVGLCSLWCQQQIGCQRFNWKLEKHSCEIYLFEPNAYLAEDTCSHYIVSIYKHFRQILNIIWRAKYSRYQMELIQILGFWGLN